MGFKGVGCGPDSPVASSFEHGNETGFYKKQGTS
jgi:hypothetical protein